MTDGCELVVWSACKGIGIVMRLQMFPIVFQVCINIAGSKGLWILHPDAKNFTVIS